VRQLAAICFVCVLFVLASAAGAGREALPQQSGVVDTASQSNVRIIGAQDYYSVASGDVNGDGRADVILGQPSAAYNGVGSGSVFVVYGRPTPGDVDLTALGGGGFRLDGTGPGDSFGASVAVVGDMTGDGISEIVASSPGESPSSRQHSGSVYVIYGAPSSGGFPLSQIGAYGFRIDGAVANDNVGAVAGGGDVNGDGRADVVIGASGADRNGKEDCGVAYVVFGKGRDSTTPVDLAGLGSAGFAMTGPAAFDYLGSAVAAGDVTGDGRADVVVGASGWGYNSGDPGQVFVVYARSSTAPVDLANLGSGGFRLTGAAPNDGLGYSVAVIGDMTGDGRSEIAVSAPEASDGGRAQAGAVYVIFGSASSGGFPLSQIGAYGFRIDGPGLGTGYGYFTTAVAGGDVNGDGRADVIVGVDGQGNGRFQAGSTYVVFGRGRDQTSPVDLADPSRVGIRIDGAVTQDDQGDSVAAGDVNGDGRTDVIVNARRSAAAHVVYGFGAPELAYGTTSSTGTVGKPIAVIAPTRVRRTGTAAFSIAPSLPAGLSLDSTNGILSGTPTTARAAKTYTVTMTDLAGSATANLSIEVEGPAASPPPPPPPPTPPPSGAAVTLDGLVLTPAHLTTGGEASLHFRLSRAATVTLRFEHVLKGHRAGKRCIAATGKPCTRYTPAGTLKLNGHAGVNSFRFTGRVGGRRLPAGTYRIRAVATANKRTSKATVTRFTVLPR
jgi:hypothetical protein